MRILVTLLFVLLSACTTVSPELRSSATPQPDEPEPGSTPKIISSTRGNSDVDELNQRLLALAARASSSASTDQYRLGMDDVLTIDAYPAEELRQYKVRIEGGGAVVLPLIGKVKLAGLTVSEAEQAVSRRVSEFVYQPQVSIFVDEYRSQEVTVTGEVAKPGIYPITRPRSLVELISLAGGLTEKASYQVNVQTQVPDPQTGTPRMESLLVDLRGLVDNVEAQQTLVLRGGDSILVSEAGTFFVDGSVGKPGRYPLQDDLNVLKAISIAGGTEWDAVEDDVRIIRRDGSDTVVIPVDLKAIRYNKEQDVGVEDGDIVVVGYSSFKRGFVIFWRGISGIFSIGYGI